MSGEREIKEWSEKFLPDPEAKYLHKTFEPKTDTTSQVSFDVRFAGVGAHMSSTLFLERQFEVTAVYDNPNNRYTEDDDTVIAHEGSSKKTEWAIRSPGLCLQNNCTKFIANYNSTTDEVRNPNIWMPEYTRLYREDLKNLVIHSGRAFENRDPVQNRANVLNYELPDGEFQLVDDGAFRDLNRVHVPSCRADRRVVFDKTSTTPLSQHHLAQYIPPLIKDSIFVDPLRETDELPSREGQVPFDIDGGGVVDFLTYLRNNAPLGELNEDGESRTFNHESIMDVIAQIWDGEKLIPGVRPDDDPYADIVDIFQQYFPTKDDFDKVFSMGIVVNVAEDNNIDLDGSLLYMGLRDGIYPEDVNLVPEDEDYQVDGFNAGQRFNKYLVPEESTLQWQDTIGFGVDLRFPFCKPVPKYSDYPKGIDIKSLSLLYRFAHDYIHYLYKSNHIDVQFMAEDYQKLMELHAKYTTLLHDSAEGLVTRYQELRNSLAAMTQYRSIHENHIYFSNQQEMRKIEAHFKKYGVYDITAVGVNARISHLALDVFNLATTYENFYHVSLRAMAGDAPANFMDVLVHDISLIGEPVKFRIVEDNFQDFVSFLKEPTYSFRKQLKEVLAWEEAVYGEYHSAIDTFDVKNGFKGTVTMIEPLSVSTLRPTEFRDFGCWGENSNILPYVKRYEMLMEFPANAKYFELDSVALTDLIYDDLRRKIFSPHLRIDNVRSKLHCTFVERAISLPRVIPMMNMEVFKLNDGIINLEKDISKSFHFSEIEIRSNVNMVMIFTKAKFRDNFHLYCDKTASLIGVEIKTDVSNQNMILHSRQAIDALTMRNYPQYRPPLGHGGNLLAIPYNEFPRSNEVKVGFNHLFGKIEIQQDFAPALDVDVYMVINYKDKCLKIENDCIQVIRNLY